MKWFLLSFLVVFFTGCKSNPKPEAFDPLKGIHQFKVVLLPFTDLEKEPFFKAVVSSFEKIGDVRFSKKNICKAEDDMPVLLLSLMDDEHRGSISIFAETEILINHCRIGSQIWKLDFNGKKEVVFPEMQEDGIVFKKEQQYEEDLGLILLQEKMIEQFAKAYWATNSVRPTFYIHSDFLTDSEVASN